MAFLQSFTAMTVAGLVWMSLFIALSESKIELLNKVGDWISPSSSMGWLPYASPCVLCFLFARRMLGHNDAASEDIVGHCLMRRG
jgi:hypothetical protein